MCDRSQYLPQHKRPGMSLKSVRRATPEDREFLAWSILTATRGHLTRGWFDICLNTTERECLNFLAELTTIDVSSPWHYSRFLLADDGANRPIAAVCAVPSPAGYQHCGVALLTCLKRLGVDRQEREAFQRRGTYLLLCASPHDRDCLVMEVSATAPGSRRQGYRAMLIDCAMADARAQGLKKAETSCFIGNHVSEHAITRSGFSFVSEKRHPDFEAVSGAPGIRRFVRDL